MVQNDLKFFTNEPERDLYSRFSAILKSNTQFFDVLVGYFRTSGFFKLYPAMDSVEKIRILVGLNVDKYTVDNVRECRVCPDRFCHPTIRIRPSVRTFQTVFLHQTPDFLQIHQHIDV